MPSTDITQTLADTGEKASDTAKNITVDAPTSLAEVQETLLNTLKMIWTGMIEHLPLLGIGIIILCFTGLVSFGVKRSLKPVLQARHVRPSLIELMLRMATIVVWTVGLTITAMVIFPDVTITKALGALGLFSLAIGFAFKDIFENFFAGILMLWKFPFESGDYIECEGINGRIESITVRQTLIRQTNGDLVVIPNAFLFKNPVEIQTQRPKRRLKLIVGVAYDTDVEAAVALITKVLEGCETVDKDELSQVAAYEFGDSSINIEVLWWTSSVRRDQRRSRNEVLIAVKKALDDAGIEIPFPYRTLTFKEDVRIAPTPDEDEADNAKA